MKINNDYLYKILTKLEDLYPHPLDSQAYSELTKEVGDDITLDAHLLYLSEKSLIISDMEYNIHESNWTVNPYGVRITSYGLDTLSEDKKY
ncbi:hypothetical protein ACI1AU_004154 [Cronobacter turicensis]